MRLMGSLLTCAALVCLQTASRAAQVTVFAAASLTDSLQEIAEAYEKVSGDKIVFNFAASGVLARQIEEGAPADLFFSADKARADALETNGLLVKATRTNLLANSLVIVTAAGQRHSAVSKRLDQRGGPARSPRRSQDGSGGDVRESISRKIRVVGGDRIESGSLRECSFRARRGGIGQRGRRAGVQNGCGDFQEGEGGI